MPTYHYSETSRARLATCHPDLQRLFYAVLVGRDHTILCGRRTRAEQDAAYAAGNSKKRWPGSKHNVADEAGNEIPGGLSLAVDAAPYFAEAPHIRWKSDRSWAHFAGYVQGVALALGIRIRCGIDWDSDFDLEEEKFVDAGHFELVLPSSRPGPVASIG